MGKGKQSMLSTIDDATLMKVATAMGEEEAVKLIEFIKNVDEITDDEIANNTGIRLNIVRRILYKLYDHSLVSLRRTRDPKTGWFIFHWKLQPTQLEGFILSQKRRVLEKLDVRLEYEKNHDFYCCDTPGCKRIPFEEAVELVFNCPTCGKPLMHCENGKFVEKLAAKVEQLRKELGE
ncbi:transcription factor [Candidatus Bathyarchaeota archaeon]|nr:transcription factor [Candidatus Bathyarchaeota archaeon]TRO51317.1 transcription factor [Candidatus Bathyarchaeota archaeon]